MDMDIKINILMISCDHKSIKLICEAVSMVPAVPPEKRKVRRCAGPAIDAPRPFRTPRENLKEKSSRIYRRRIKEEKEEVAHFNKGQSMIPKRD